VILTEPSDFFTCAVSVAKFKPGRPWDNVYLFHFHVFSSTFPAVAWCQVRNSWTANKRGWCPYILQWGLRVTSRTGN